MKKFISIQQLCDWLNVKESHVRSLIFKREIPFFKVGRAIRFNTQEIESWLEQQRNTFMSGGINE